MSWEAFVPSKAVGSGFGSFLYLALWLLLFVALFCSWSAAAYVLISTRQRHSQMEEGTMNFMQIHAVGV